MAQPRDPRAGNGSSTHPPHSTTGPNAGRTDPRATGHADTGTTDREHNTVPNLVRQLTSDVTSLFTKEISLARSEMRESVKDAKTGLASMTGGGVVLLAGMIVLLMAAVYGLATVLSLWLSALIVGGVVTIIGFIMLKSGQSKLKAGSFKPDRTMHEMQKDREALKHEMRSEKHSRNKGAIQ